MAFLYSRLKCASSLKGALFALALTAIPAHASITFSLTFNGVGVTLFPSPLNVDSMSIGAAQDFTHFSSPMTLNTNYNIADLVLNFNAGSNQNSTQSLNINQVLTIGSLSGESLSNASSQTLAFVLQDAASGSSHVLTATTLPTATFLFTDGTKLVITATSVPTLTLASNKTSNNNAMNFNIDYTSGAPEPSSVGLAALGMLGMAAVLRRRSQATI